ncbi:carboxylesterase/lipase family protein [Leucobacter sp. M11]|uniref:carboxylesterase/lipase family protein n=1 Tax=Leucobacter sp. M11 TaxID=2993565 RepID=UPI002D7F2003|nr:carboxylesterase family protein [Leucobacter sp. M11]MEB4615605.1 carboxylesterase family protein [Leucobacter sp. M11]
MTVDRESHPGRYAGASSPEPAGTHVETTITAGTVVGVAQHGVARFLGIPYAAAPVGAHRFRDPAPAPEWAEPRDARRPGPTAPQTPYPGALGEVLPSVEIPGEEFLNANVWAPARPTANGHPVVFWVHGGAFSRGSNALGVYDGEAFARDGVVLIAVNYRLGAEGFSVLDGVPRNLGLRDLRFALDWAIREAPAFGGDPTRITLMGESAGGTAVAALLAMPGVAERVAGAIIQSGPLEALPAERAGRITRAQAKHLGVPATAAAFAEQTPAQLLEAHSAVSAGSNPVLGGPGFGLVLDPETVPVSPAESLPGLADRVPLLIGTTEEEYRLWFVPGGLITRLTRLHLFLARRKVGVSANAVRLFHAHRPGASAGELLGAIATDVLLRVPALRLAERRRAAGARSFLFEFGWKTPVQHLGAAHSLELGFVFDTLAAPDVRAMTGEFAPQALADEMHAAWVAFAASGDPGWPAWSERHPVRVFGGAGEGLASDLRGDEARAIAPDLSLPAR